jgi:hypothetical protein
MVVPLVFGFAMIHATQRIINASYNQRQRFFKSLTMDGEIAEGNVRAPNASRLLRAPNIYWPHISWLFQTVKKEALIAISVDNSLR